jgi:signal transduction histidine kinase
LLGRTFADIAQLLESAEGAGERVRRALELVGTLVPYDQCAVLEAQLGEDPHVVMVPEVPPHERDLLTATLVDLFGKLVDSPASKAAPVARLQGAHLAVPLVGLDEVLGLLFVRSSAGAYTEDHLGALSVIAAKLAAYFTMLRARAELAEVARERDQARRAAEAANRAKDEFLALVSYELKTPLSSSLAWAHTLRSTTDEAARARAIDGLEANVKAQARLIDDILDLACVGAAELRLNLRTVEPAPLIEATIEGLRLEAARKAIRIESDLDATAIPLVLDPDRIAQVVSILVASAIHFTPVGGQVQVRLERVAGFARIQVSDSGSGISPEALPQVFERFPRAADAGRRFPGARDGGLGVGLAIVKDLVELHGGRVQAESAGLERGTTLTVELPYPSRGGASRPLPASAGPDARLLAGVRVLLVDHDLELRESFRAVLDDHGAQVTAVASAPEALLALERSWPDVLLFGDLAMHGEAVYDLMHEVTARACSLPVASISAWRLEERERALAAGFRLHLVKPLAIGALIEAVAELAGRGAARAPRLSVVPAAKEN